MQLNRIQLIGRLGGDADVRYTQSKSMVVSFNMASTKKWNNKDGEKQEKTTWARVNLWGKTGEYAVPFLTKGALVFVEGSLENNDYTDKDGNKVRTMQINGQAVAPIVYPPKEQVENNQGGHQPNNQPQEEDIPF